MAEAEQEVTGNLSSESQIGFESQIEVVEGPSQVFIRPGLSAMIQVLN